MFGKLHLDATVVQAADDVLQLRPTWRLKPGLPSLVQVLVVIHTLQVCRGLGYVWEARFLGNIQDEGRRNRPKVLSGDRRKVGRHRPHKARILKKTMRGGAKQMRSPIGRPGRLGTSKFGFSASHGAGGTLFRQNPTHLGRFRPIPLTSRPM